MTRYDPHPEAHDDARSTPSGFTDRRESDENGSGVPHPLTREAADGLRGALEALAAEWEWDAASSHTDTMARAMWVGALGGCARELRAVLAAHPADAPAGPEPDPFLAEIRAAVDAADRDAPQRCGHSSEPMCCPFENFPTLAAWFRQATADAPAEAPEPSGDVIELATQVLLDAHGADIKAHALRLAGLLADPAETERLLGEARGTEGRYFIARVTEEENEDAN